MPTQDDMPEEVKGEESYRNVLHQRNMHDRRRTRRTAKKKRRPCQGKRKKTVKRPLYCTCVHNIYQGNVHEDFGAEVDGLVHHDLERAVNAHGR